MCTAVGTSHIVFSAQNLTEIILVRKLR